MKSYSPCEVFEQYWGSQSREKLVMEIPFSGRLLSSLYYMTDVGPIPRGFKPGATPAPSFYSSPNWRRSIQGCYWCCTDNVSHQAICCSTECLMYLHEWCVFKVNDLKRNEFMCRHPGCNQDSSENSSFCTKEHFSAFQKDWNELLNNPTAFDLIKIGPKWYLKSSKKRTSTPCAINQGNNWELVTDRKTIHNTQTRDSSQNISHWDEWIDDAKPQIKAENHNLLNKPPATNVIDEWIDDPKSQLTAENHNLLNKPLATNAIDEWIDDPKPQLTAENQNLLNKPPATNAIDEWIDDPKPQLTAENQNLLNKPPATNVIDEWIDDPKPQLTAENQNLLNKPLATNVIGEWIDDPKPQLTAENQNLLNKPPATNVIGEWIDDPKPQLTAENQNLLNKPPATNAIDEWIDDPKPQLTAENQNLLNKPPATNVIGEWIDDPKPNIKAEN